MALSKDEILDAISEMSVMDVVDLVSAMEEKFGVSAQAAVAVAAPAAGGEEAAAEEKDSFTIVLAAAGDKKINVIKEVRAATSLGLKEAKDLVESAPKPIKEEVSKEESEEIKTKVEASGASVEIS